ncbi:MAG: TetR/AcrR family transcriptional regulator [Bacilli bacterium]|nr:TetR/AcrR family transcriptional regulator [Bacilli bacterium]
MSVFKKSNGEINKTVKESLQKALVILMDKKKFDVISITELCRIAGVSRVSFYNNYKTLNDLLKDLIHTQTYYIINSIGTPFTENISVDWYRKLFQGAYDNKFYLTTIFKSGFKYEYLSVITDMLLQNKKTSPETKYLRLMWAGAIVNTVIYWMENGMQESVDEIAQFCYHNLSVQN